MVETPVEETPVEDEAAAWEAENDEEETEQAEVEAEEEVEEEATEEATEEVEAETETKVENEEEDNDEEEDEEEDEEAENGEAKKKAKRPNNYHTTHPEEFKTQVMRDVRNDYNTANRRGHRSTGMKKDVVRLRQKRAQLSLDTIIVYGEREYRNCSSVPLMSLSHTMRESIVKHRRNIAAGKRDDCALKLHHTIVKVDAGLGLNGLRSVIKWLHTGDLNLTAENFEEIVASTLYFRIKLLRQSLVALGRKVGIKFIPVPANEKTIERRKKEGKPTLPDGSEEALKLGEGEDPLPEDAPVVEGKDVLARIKGLDKVQYLTDIPKSEHVIKQEAAKAAKNLEKQKSHPNNRKRGHSEKSADASEAKKSKHTSGDNRPKAEVKSNAKSETTKQNGHKPHYEKTSGGARGRGSGHRGNFNHTRGGARGGSQNAGKSIYREGAQSYQPPAQPYYQPNYAAPAPYAYAPPAPQYQQQPMQGYQQPQAYQRPGTQYRQPQQGGGYYGGY